MSDIRLTQDAEYLLCELYNAYRMRKKNGINSDDAKLFGGSEYIQSDYIQQWTTNEIDEAARELSQAGMLNCNFSENSLSECQLLSNGIIYMEHRFGDKIDKFLQHLSTLRAIILG